MKKFIVVLLLECGVLSACRDNETLTSYVEDYNPVSISEKTDSSFVDPALAKLVAIKQIDLQTRSALDVDDIVTLSNAKGEPTIYVVNYKNDNGYVMVSATKNYHPVLMKADKGKFCQPDLPEPARWYIETYKSEIEDLKKAPYDSIYNYRKEWNAYENKQAPAITRSLSSLPVEVQRYVQDQCDEWTSMGYEYSVISENGLNLPEDLYIQALAYAEMSLREDYMETSFVVKMNEVNRRINIGPMLTTKWGQKRPYNLAVIQLYGKEYPTGCVATAMAQIMNYHRKPTSYDWENMENDSLNIANLMLDVGLATDMNYSINGSGTTPEKAVAAFQSYGYDNASLISHNQSKVESQLSSSLPVYMRGEEGIYGHAWVCDGFRYYTFQDSYYLMHLKLDELTYISHLLKTENEFGTRSFHMNWGYKGDGDGWFSDNNIKFRLQNQTEYHNYNINRKDIISIY